MKLFYDIEGNVVGSFEGATPEIEGRVGLPSNAIGHVVAAPDLVDRLNDPMDPLQAHHLTIIAGEPESPDLESLFPRPDPKETEPAAPESDAQSGAE